MSCCDCSTTEGESELSTDHSTEQLPVIYLYTKVQLTFCSFTLVSVGAWTVTTDTFLACR